VIHAARRAHETQHVQRHERGPEADEPAPERALAERFVQLETNAFGNQ